MTGVTQRLTDEQPKHSNGKAVASLVLGIFAMANIALLALIFTIWTEDFDDSAFWLLPVFLAVVCGAIAAFLGSIAWIDVRRGVTDQRLREAQAGAVLGAVAVGLVLLAVIVLLVIFVLLVTAFGAPDGALE